MSSSLSRLTFARKRNEEIRFARKHFLWLLKAELARLRRADSLNCIRIYSAFVRITSPSLTGVSSRRTSSKFSRHDSLEKVPESFKDCTQIDSAHETYSTGGDIYLSRITAMFLPRPVVFGRVFSSVCTSRSYSLLLELRAEPTKIKRKSFLKRELGTKTFHTSLYKNSPFSKLRLLARHRAGHACGFVQYTRRYKLPKARYIFDCHVISVRFLEIRS